MKRKEITPSTDDKIRMQTEMVRLDMAKEQGCRNTDAHSGFLGLHYLLKRELIANCASAGRMDHGVSEAIRKRSKTIDQLGLLENEDGRWKMDAR